MTLPDSSFLYARKRLFPYKDGEGGVDGSLVESAVADIATSQLSAPVKASLMTRAKAIARRTVEAELWSYITHKKSAPKKESDMGKVAYNRISEVFTCQVELLKLRTKIARQRLAAVPTQEPAEPKEQPVAESMMESYPLSAEVLSEAAALEEGKDRIIKNCVFLRAGLNAPKTRRWTEELLRANVELFEDSLTFIDHPKEGEPRSLRALAGHTQDVRFDEVTKSVVGDIRLLDNEAADYVVSVFGNQVVRDSGAVGLSVLWEGGGFEADFEDYGGRTIQVPTELTAKCQVDFVANPTAFGKVGTL